MAKVSIDLRKVALHERSQSQAANELYDVFVAPFVPLFTALKLTIADVVNLTWSGLQLIFTSKWDPEAQQKAIKTYLGRADNINKKWDELRDDLKLSADQKMVAFLLNPAGYIGANAAKLGFDFLAGEGGVLDLSTPVPSAIRKFFGKISRFEGEDDDEGKGQPWFRPQPEDVAKLKAMYLDLIKHGPEFLNRLFVKDPGTPVKESFVASKCSANDAKALLYEQVNDKRLASISKGLGMDNPRVKNALDLAALGLLETKRTLANQSLDAYRDSLEAIKILRGVDDVTKLKPAFDALAKLQPDLRSKLASALQTLETKAKELAATPEFKQDNSKLSVDASEKDVLQLARSSLVASLITELSPRLEEAVGEFAKRLHDEVFFDWPTKQELAALPQNEFTKQAIQLMDEFDGSLRNIGA